MDANKHEYLSVPARFRDRAFTLLELMVVIAIVVVLAGLLFPAVQSVLDRAKKVQAKNDVIQIVIAVNAFYTEYGRYPTDQTTDTAATYGGSNSSKVLFDELRAKTASFNTRQIIFISPPEDSTQTSPKGKIGSDGQFHDPWGTAYLVRMDANYDNNVDNAYTDGSAGGDSSANYALRLGVIAWSVGKDAKPGNNGNNSFKNSSGVQSDDVISWQ